MLQYKTKTTFPMVLRLFGCLFMGCGLILLLGSSFVGIPLVLVGAIFIFTFEGVMYDPEKGRFKEFIGFLGLKSGKWKSSEGYPFIALLNFNVQSAIYSLSNSKSVSSKKVYRLYMLSPSHFSKILIKEFKTEENAKEFAEKFVRETGLELVAYSPQISEASRNRRR